MHAPKQAVPWRIHRARPPAPYRQLDKKVHPRVTSVRMTLPRSRSVVAPMPVRCRIVSQAARPSAVAENTRLWRALAAVGRWWRWCRDEGAGTAEQRAASTHRWRSESAEAYFFVFFCPFWKSLSQICPCWFEFEIWTQGLALSSMELRIHYLTLALMALNCLHTWQFWLMCRKCLTTWIVASILTPPVNSLSLTPQVMAPSLHTYCINIQLNKVTNNLHILNVNAFT